MWADARVLTNCSREGGGDLGRKHSKLKQTLICIANSKSFIAYVLQVPASSHAFCALPASMRGREAENLIFSNKITTRQNKSKCVTCDM